MKYTSARPLADPETGARKLVEIASGIQPVQDGRVFIELINVPFLKQELCGILGDEAIRRRGFPALG